MGLLEKLLRPTPFYKTYLAFKKRKAEAAQAALEAGLAPARVAFYQKLILPGDTVFDIGANVGNRVDAFLACGARVVAVEPQPSCVAVLRQKFADRITIENIGLAGAPGELEMHLSTDSTVSTFSTEFIENTKERFKYSRWTDTIKVPISTLDALVAKHGVPGFCKIDVEGFEPEVLKGLHQPLPVVSLEYCVPEVAEGLRTCVNLLHELAPTGSFNYCIGERMQWALPQWMSYEEFVLHIRTEAFTSTSFGDIYFKSAG
ncbi:FkbM family methyltransferase [Flaviaesturariibacter flavus]|uniref:FkbM family methyltransferase n=1 Tax=Flaviaesturariibacter flavus TaxID=2502780 RepID=A0A4R1BJF7_9BACT|nr:FkbM family methyltransferase [Flaviaesturariibacter flavus]TCJ17463.1 FkbM family methyltransferase [Flaviaesturariibacter flavus]